MYIETKNMLKFMYEYYISMKIIEVKREVKKKKS